MQPVITGLLWFSAIGCGLLAGLYFAFSTFIMTALGRIGQVRDRHVRVHGRLQRALEQRLGCRRSRRHRGRLALGPLSDRLDAVESRPDGFVHTGVRAIHLGYSGELATLMPTGPDLT
jgi:hypothetical protein